MGPPPRSLAADAHGCIMVRMLEDHILEHPPNTRLWRDVVTLAGSPQIVLSAQTAVDGRRRLTRGCRSAPPVDSPPNPDTEQVERVPCR